MQPGKGCYLPRSSTWLVPGRWRPALALAAIIGMPDLWPWTGAILLAAPRLASVVPLSPQRVLGAAHDTADGE